MTDKNRDSNIETAFHVLTVGWNDDLVEKLGNPIERKTAQQFSHLVHPRFVSDNWPIQPKQQQIYFFREYLRQPMPPPDERLLRSLERDDVPTLHNMILGDRVLSKLGYSEALGYATFIAQRLMSVLEQVRPSVVIVGFDAVHASLALAVARYMNVPVFALNFSPIPRGFVCLCDRMNPSARVTIRRLEKENLEKDANRYLREFERRQVTAPAYLAPQPASLLGKAGHLPDRLRAATRILKRSRDGEFLKYTDERSSYSITRSLSQLIRTSRSRRANGRIPALRAPPSKRYVLFGLHMQPESSIDVWAPFFSNQMWVVELLARCIPPSHSLLVKIHKSDIANYSDHQLRSLQALPGVEFVQPFADTRDFLERADAVVSIQGTMGLEAALLGKPTIMLGESPATQFPSVSAVGEIRNLPSLMRAKLEQPVPERSEIVAAFARYLAPLFSACPNNWSRAPDDKQIDGFADMFRALESHLSDPASGGVGRSSEQCAAEN